MRIVAACFAAFLALSGFAACDAVGTSHERTAAVDRGPDRPERYLPDDLEDRPDLARLVNPRGTFDTDEDGQPDTLPRLPFGMTTEMIREGDRLFHGRGGCIDCHGSEAQGLPARGKTLTVPVHFIPPGDWRALDSLILVGMRGGQTRSPIAMPPRGQDSNLTTEEVHHVGAYIWAISQTKGEPWPGGHDLHAVHDLNASARTSIP